MSADCFIVTAAGGTDGHADVAALRSFRDDSSGTALAASQ